MAVCKVLRLGHPLLRVVADKLSVEDIGRTFFKELVQDMTDTLAEQGGIGLAATQIGISLRVAIIAIAGGPSRYGELEAMPLTVFVNPEIEIIDPKVAGYWEGCLSIPGMRGYVERPQHIVLHYLDSAAEPQQLELRGFIATVFQHELDHLDGKLYVDHIQDMRRFVYETEFEQFIAPNLE